MLYYCYTILKYHASTGCVKHIQYTNEWLTWCLLRSFATAALWSQISASGRPVKMYLRAHSWKHRVSRRLLHKNRCVTLFAWQNCSLWRGAFRRMPASLVDPRTWFTFTWQAYITSPLLFRDIAWGFALLAGREASWNTCWYNVKSCTSQWKSTVFNPRYSTLLEQLEVYQLIKKFPSSQSDHKLSYFSLTDIFTIYSSNMAKVKRPLYMPWRHWSTTFWISTLDGGVWTPSCPDHFTPHKNCSQYPLNSPTCSLTTILTAIPAPHTICYFI